MKRPLIAAALGGLGLLLAACGTSQGDRLVSGTVIGAVAGGATGVLTSPRAVDLGRPVWR